MQPAINAGTLVRGETSPIIGLRYSADGAFFAAANLSQHVTVWWGGRVLFEQSMEVCTTGQKGRVRDFEISAGGRSLFVAAGETVSEINLEFGTTMWSTGRNPTFGFLITCPQALSLAPSGELAMAYDDGSMLVCPMGFPGRPPFEWRDNDAPFAMEYLPNGRTLVGTDGYTISLWDPHSGKKKGRANLGRKICALACGRQTYLVAVRTLRSVYLWDPQQFQVLATMPVLTGLPTVAISDCGEWIAAGDNLGVSVFTASGTLIDRYPQVETRTTAITFKPGHPTIAVGSADGSIVMWQFRT